MRVCSYLRRTWWTPPVALARGWAGPPNQRRQSRLRRHTRRLVKRRLLAKCRHHGPHLAKPTHLAKRGLDTWGTANPDLVSKGDQHAPGRQDSFDHGRLAWHRPRNGA